MEAVLLTLRVVQVGREVLDGLAHACGSAYGHVAEGFLPGRAGLLGSLVLIQVADDQTLGQFTAVAPRATLWGHAWDAHPGWSHAEIHVLVGQVAGVG